MKAFTYKEMENIFEIGRTMQAMFGNEEIDIEDSKEAFNFALGLAIEFEKEYPDTDDYYNDIDEFAIEKFGKKGIYVGSTCISVGGEFTYGGFNFTTYWTLKDQFVLPNGNDFKPCQCAHGNITYISDEVVKKMGILCERYIHGGGDHDYTYLAYKAGFPVLVMPHYCGICENDHSGESKRFEQMTLKERIKFLKSPFGLNLNNTLLFNSRCFPLRVPFVWVMGYMKAIFPQMFYGIYRFLRR